MNNQSEDRVLGYVGTYPVGDYNEQTEYEYLNVVTHRGSSYVCIKEEGCTAVEPPNKECWQLFAGKGDTGEKGDTGDVGPVGPKPVNGVDYNTEAEQKEFKDKVVADSKADLEKYITEKETQLDNYTKEKETKLDDYVTDTVKPTIDTYVTDTTKKDIDKYEKEKEKVLDTYIDTKKTEIDNYVTNTSKPALDQYEKDKEAELETAKNTAISEYDAHAESVLTETDDLFNALDTEKISGTELYIEDAKPCRVINAGISGMYKQETTSGKNLLEVVATSKTINGITFTINKDKTVTVNGTANGNAILILNSFDFQNEETYILNGCPNNGGINSYKLDAFGQTGLSDDIGNGIGINTGGQRNIRIVIFDGNSVNNLVFRPMIIKGSQATEYEPYTGAIASPSPNYPQKIEQADRVKLQYTGSNLFDYTKISIIPSSTSGLVITLEKNGDITVSGKPKYSYTMVVPVQDITDILKDGETYYINQSSYNKFVFLEVTATKNDGSIIYLGTTVSQKKFVVNKTNFKKYTIKVVCCNLSTWGEEEKTITSNFKLTRQKSVPFEKYVGKAINIDLKGNKLCAVSDTIKDKLLIDRNGNVALQKNVGFKLLDGSENWFINDTSSSNQTHRFGFNLSSAEIDSFTIAIRSNSLISVTASQLFLNDIECIAKSISQLLIRIDENRGISNVEQLKTWLASNNMKVYYAATPEIIDLGQLPELPKTFNGINNVWAETNLGNTEIEVEYVQDVKKLLEKQAEQQNARLDNIEALLSTTETSALLLDNMQTDLEKEVE